MGDALTPTRIKRCQICGSDYPLEHAGEVCSLDGGQLVAAPLDQLIGSLIDARYKIESTLGLGGWATVYLATDQKLDRKVAVKILHAFWRESADQLNRFRRESKLAASLTHPNLAMLFDYGVLSNGQPFLIMEYLRGETLEQLISREGRLPVKRTVALVGQICDALNFAHKRGVIHRDLKPANIVVLDGDAVKLLDFGLASWVDSSLSLTSPGESVGTPQYMSPEQCQGKQVDLRSDIYSLGLIIYKMLTGTRPFQGRTMFEAFSEHINQPPKPLVEACPDLYFPPLVREAVMRCLAKEASERFADCIELKQALQYGASSDGQNAAAGASDAARSGAPFAANNRSLSHKKPRLYGRVVGIAIGLLVTVGLALFAFVQHHEVRKILDETKKPNCAPSLRERAPFQQC